MVRLTPCVQVPTVAGAGKISKAVFLRLRVIHSKPLTVLRCMHPAMLKWPGE